MAAVGRAVDEPANVYLTGGASAVLFGWRESTIDVDFSTSSERVVVAASRLKDELDVNLEIAAPHDFIPELPGWRERSIFIAREGAVSFFHYDLYAQALSKIERGHEQDMKDVRAMLADGLVDSGRLRELFGAIRPALERYPAIDEPSFVAAVEAAIAD